jgi:hypothetical protein
VRPGAVREVAHPAQQIAVRDSRRHDDHLLRREVVDGEDPFHVLEALTARVVDLAS